MTGGLGVARGTALCFGAVLGPGILVLPAIAVDARGRWRRRTQRPVPARPRRRGRRCLGASTPRSPIPVTSATAGRGRGAATRLPGTRSSGAAMKVRIR